MFVGLGLLSLVVVLVPIIYGLNILKLSVSIDMIGSKVLVQVRDDCSLLSLLVEPFCSLTEIQKNQNERLD